LIPEFEPQIYYNYYFEDLKDFSDNKLEIVGKYKFFKTNKDYHKYYKPYLKTLCSLSDEQLETIGQNAPCIFVNIPDDEHGEFIEKNLKGITPAQIENFAKKKREEIYKNK
jgi:hypothetical protein